MNVEVVPVARLHCSPSNPRKNDAAVPHVAASIKRFNWQQPIVAKPNGEIIIGNTRFKAACALGMTEVPVVWFTGDGVEAAALQIADNRTNEFSEWDDEALARMLQELDKAGALGGVGYSDAEVREMIRKADVAAQRASSVEDEGPPPTPKKAVTQLGDLWTMDEHRLVCGDSTKSETFKRLMGDDRAALLSTDPPYCVDYTGMDRPVHDGKPSGKDWSNVYNEVDIKDLGKFLESVFAAVVPMIRDGCAIYVWHAHLQQPTIQRVFDIHDLLLHQVLVWVKPVPTFGHSFYQWKHEPCAFGWRRGHKPRHPGGPLPSVWEVDWEGKSRIVGNEHPTQKPLRLFEIPMEAHTDEGDIVLEPFSGSGSQLVAAAKLKRCFRGVELQPVFVDVAVRRWIKATGRKAYLDGDGRDFWEVAKDRGVEVPQ